MEIDTAVLKAIWVTTARGVYSSEALARLISPSGKSEKQFAAYNMCDGQHSQAEICDSVQIHKGVLSSSISNWVEQGIVIRFGEGKDMRPLHVYPLSKEYWGQGVKKNDD